MKKLKLIKQTNEQKDNKIVSLRTWKTGARIKIGPMKTKRSKRKWWWPFGGICSR